MTGLQKELEEAVRKDDERGVQQTLQELERLHWQVLSNQDWYWREQFELLIEREATLVPPADAHEWLERGRRAMREGNQSGLREAVERLWKLTPPDMSAWERQPSAQAGLRSAQ